MFGVCIRLWQVGQEEEEEECDEGEDLSILLPENEKENVQSFVLGLMESVINALPAIFHESFVKKETPVEIDNVNVSVEESKVRHENMNCDDELEDDETMFLLNNDVDDETISLLNNDRTLEEKEDSQNVIKGADDEEGFFLGSAHLGKCGQHILILIITANRWPTPSFTSTWPQENPGISDFYLLFKLFGGFYYYTQTICKRHYNWSTDFSRPMTDQIHISLYQSESLLQIS